MLRCKRRLVPQPCYFRTVLDEKRFAFKLVRLVLVCLVISVGFEQRSLGAGGVELVCSR